MSRNKYFFEGKNISLKKGICPRIKKTFLERGEAKGECRRVAETSTTSSYSLTAKLNFFDKEVEKSSALNFFTSKQGSWESAKEIWILGL